MVLRKVSPCTISTFISDLCTDRHERVIRLLAVQKSYGIVIDDMFQWLVLEDDAISQSRVRDIRSEAWVPNMADADRSEFKIYSYKRREGEEDRLPTRYSQSRGGNVAPKGRI